MKKILLILAVLGLALSSFATEVVYQIEEYNNDIQDFRLKSFGTEPYGSYVFFENEYGATSGNRYNQIPRNKEASLTLVGWEGCRIDSVVLSLCSNNKAGQLKLHVTAGDTVIYTMRAADFADSVWYGEWLSKDLGVYADITKAMQVPYMVGEDEDVVIALKGGTAEGSVYVKRIVVHYTAVLPMPTQSPMGYVYEKLEKKSVLADGDTIILYRSGSAAGDYDGMETSHYLDAVAISNTSNVYELGVSHFVLHKDSAQHWMMITLDEDTLGASGLKNLCWNGGLRTWDIELTYNGASISSTNSNYGTLAYNAPAGSYARFWNYSASSQGVVLPYMYRRLKQNQPVKVSSVTLPEYRIAYIENDTAVLRAVLLPKTATDERVVWSSSDTAVATVRDGVVKLKKLGTANITCTSWDGQQSATCTMDIVNAPVHDALPTLKDNVAATKELRDGQVVVVRGEDTYTLTGAKR